MFRNVKIDKIDGSNVHITINCYEDPNIVRQEDDALRIPIRRVKKPPFFKGECQETIVSIDGVNWPRFAEYVTKNLVNGDKKPRNACKPKAA